MLLYLCTNVFEVKIDKLLVFSSSLAPVKARRYEFGKINAAKINKEIKAKKNCDKYL